MFIEEKTAKIHKSDKVFYNDAQIINRDFSILIINNFFSNVDKKIRIFEGMSATGLRAIRYFKEITLENVEFYINDISNFAIENIKKNFELNHIEFVEKDIVKEEIMKCENNSLNSIESEKNKIFLSKNDCNLIMSIKKYFFNVIDIDPFGSFTPFLPSIFNSIKNNGLLCLTATDSQVLCVLKKQCQLKYDFKLEKTPFFAENSLRICLSIISRIGNLYNFRIVPILSLSVDFFVRIFVKVERKKSDYLNEYVFVCKCGYYQKYDTNTQQKSSRKNKNYNKTDTRKTENINNKNEYENENEFEKNKFELRKTENINNKNEYENENNSQKNKNDSRKNENINKNIEYKRENKSNLCIFCNKKLKLIGPIWLAPLHDKEFIKNITSSDMRVNSFLNLIKQELNTFGYIHIPSICSALKINCVPINFLIHELKNRNFDVSYTHCRKDSLKTDCPFDVIKEILCGYKEIVNKETRKKKNKKIERNFSWKEIYDNKGPGKKP